MGPERPVPAEAPLGSERARADRVGHHLHGQPEPHPLRAPELAAEHLADVVGRHQLHRARAEQPLAVQLAAVGEHLAEPGVVLGLRDQPAGTRGISLREAEERGDLAHLVGTRPVDGGQTVGALVRPVEEGRVVHAERREDAILDEFVERLPGRDLDHARQGVDPREAAVAPLRPRLEVEGDPRQPGDVGFQRVVGVPGPERPVRGLPRPDPAAAQAGRVRQQVADRDLALGRDELDLAVLLDRDLQVLEAGDVLRDRVGEPDLALLDQHHDGDARHRLGGGGHAEEGVRGHGLARLGVRQAVGREVDDLPLAGDERHGPGDVMLVDVTLHDLVDAMQPLRRDPHVFRPRPRQCLLRPGRSRRDQDQDGEAKTPDESSRDDGADIDRTLTHDAPRVGRGSDRHA